MILKTLTTACLALLLAVAPASAQVLGAQNVTAESTGACNAGACAAFDVPASAPSVTLQVSGTFSGTLTFEATSDNITWFTVMLVKLGDGASATTTTATGQFSLANSGVLRVRARATTLASGTARVTATRGGALARWLAPYFTTVTAADALILGAATTSGIRLEVNAGYGDVREGDDSAAGPWRALSLTATQLALATTSTDGVVLENLTAATSGATVQQSPRIRLRSNVWNTTATAATNTNDWIIESVPVSGSTPSGLLKFGSSLNGAGYTFPMTLNSAGALTTSVLSATSVTASANISATGGEVIVQNDVRFGSPADNAAHLRDGDNSIRFTFAAWGTTMSAPAVSYAQDATQSLGAAPLGTLYLTIGTENKMCVFELSGGGNAVAEIRDSGTICTTTKDNAATVNVYFDTNAYFIQNKIAATRTIRAVLIGG